MIRERVIEGYLFQECKKLGALCVKMEPRYNAGIPDRLVIYMGMTVFVEVKAPGKLPTERQLRYHRKLLGVGMGVVVIDTKPKVDTFIEQLKERGEKKDANAG